MFAKLAQYPTFQVFITIAATMMMVALIIPLLIRILRALHIGQEVRVDGPARHLVEKQGTPTMGGIAVVTIAIFVFGVMTFLSQPAATAKVVKIVNYSEATKAALTVVFTMVACGLLGFFDDYSKVAHRRSLGLTATAKLIGQYFISFTSAMLAINWLNLSPNVQVPATRLFIPMGIWTSELTVGSLSLSFPWIYLLFVATMIVGMTNAVNLTDGLDGLASGTVMIVALVFAGIAYAQDSLPVALIAAAVTGSCIGFLWWNSHPADIFMGDTGSLALGGAIGALAMVTNNELLILILGGIFVLEAASVAIQVLVFKRTGKRVFRMAPIHHHFEQLGWSETKVTIRLWIVTGIFAGLGFAIYFFQSTRLG